MADNYANLSFSHHRNDDVYDLSTKIMLTAIISLSVVVLLVIVLHIYARFVLRRQARLRRQAFLGRVRSTGLTSSAGDQPKTGLDPMVINSLPMFIFKQYSNYVSRYARDQDGSSKECAVCLSILEEEETVRLLPNCKHTFHAECIDKWLASHSTCPICRMEAEPLRQLLPEPREGPAMENIDTIAAIAEAHSIERVDSMEGTSSAKVNNGSSSKMSSFRRILSRERSTRRFQSCEADDQDGIQDVERQ